MTAAECLETFGESFSVTYWNGTELVQTNALYQNTATLGTVPSVAVTDYLQNGRTVLAYSFSGSISGSPEQIQIDLQPQYSLFDIDQLHTVIMTPSGATPTTPYQSPQWIWMLGGKRTVFEGISANNDMFRIPVNNTLCLYAPVDWSSQSLSSGYSVRAVFSGGQLLKQNDLYWIYIGVPYISSGASGSQGTFSDSQTSASVSGDINVSVDMSETNGILDSIKDILSGIVSGVAGIFVPDQDFLLDWKVDMGGILDDTFGKYTEIDDLLERVKNMLVDTQPNAVVRFPGIHPPGSSFFIPAQDVNAVPPALADFVEYIKFGFDILATCLFVNSCKLKWDEVVLGKTVVEIEGSD